MKRKISIKNIREEFPILKKKINNQNLIYVDNASSTQKPKAVINKIKEIYENNYSNVHRGIHTLSENMTKEYEETRKTVAKFVSAKENEIIFTKGTTNSINIIANGIQGIKKGDEIVLSISEHHANLVPWQELCKRTGAKLKFIPLNKDFEIDISQAKKIITNKTKLVAISHISNVLGSINDVEKIIKIAKKKGALVLIDSAQSIVHKKINVKKLNCDFLSFSAHKMYGPNSLGILYVKEDLLGKIKPLEFGGNMIEDVELNSSSYAKGFQKFEAGTPSIVEVIAFKEALNLLNSVSVKNIEKHELDLTKYFLKEVKKIKSLEIFGKTKSSNRIPVFSFTMEGIHAHDISSLLDAQGIATRSGHHCTIPLHKEYNLKATTRISFGIYNTKKEIDSIIKALQKIEKLS